MYINGYKNPHGSANFEESFSTEFNTIYIYIYL